MTEAQLRAFCRGDRIPQDSEEVAQYLAGKALVEEDETGCRAEDVLRRWERQSSYPRHPLDWAQKILARARRLRSGRAA